MKTKALLLALLITGCDITDNTVSLPTEQAVAQCKTAVADKTKYEAAELVSNTIENRSEENNGLVFVDYVKPNNSGNIKFRCDLETQKVELWAQGAAMWTEL